MGASIKDKNGNEIGRVVTDGERLISFIFIILLIASVILIAYGILCDPIKKWADDHETAADILEGLFYFVGCLAMFAPIVIIIVYPIKAIKKKKKAKKEEKAKASNIAEYIEQLCECDIAYSVSSDSAMQNWKIIDITSDTDPDLLKYGYGRAKDLKLVKANSVPMPVLNLMSRMDTSGQMKRLILGDCTILCVNREDGTVSYDAVVYRKGEFHE